MKGSGRKGIDGRFWRPIESEDNFCADPGRVIIAVSKTISECINTFLFIKSFLIKLQFDMTPNSFYILQDRTGTVKASRPDKNIHCFGSFSVYNVIDFKKLPFIFLAIRQFSVTGYRKNG
jgi:hypothetical protein